MEFLTSEVVQAVGVVFVAAALVQIVLMLFSNFRRVAFQRAEEHLSLDLLHYRVSAALAQSLEERDRAELSWNGFRKFEIQQKIPEGGGVHSFVLVPHDGKPLPPFLPGQYLTFQLRIPDEPKPVIRCYSLSDSPNHPDYYRVSIKKVPPPPDKPDAPSGLSSTFFNDVLNEGAILDVKAPSGHFFMERNKTTPVVLIGGGIGITPVLSMLNDICETGLLREVWFFLGVRNSAEHVFKEHLEQLARENENVHLHVCYSDPLDGDVEGVDYQHRGWVSVDLFKEVLPANNLDYYLCGPPPMMDSVTTGLREWGVPKESVNFEAFGPATVKKTAAKPDGGDEADSSAPVPKVSFTNSGKTLKWDPSAESLLDFAEANGVVIESGCRAGNCGTCITAIKEGEVAYNIEPGSPPEDGSCLTCIAVPKTDVAIDA